MNIQSLVVAGESLLEVDHLFICVEVAPNPDVLRQLGLICSSRKIQRPDQGTASVLIFFENTYLELIWIENAEIAEIYAMRSGIDFLARSHWQQTKASPFGIALRRKSDAVKFQFSELWITDDPSNDCLDQFIRFAANNLVAQAEPLCFMIPESIALTALLDLSLEAHQQLVAHPLGIKTLTQICVAIDQTRTLSDPLTLLLRDGVIAVEKNQPPCLELTFDHGIQEQALDLRSVGIPMLVKY